MSERPAILAKLKLHYRENHARNIILTGELCRSVKLFKDAEIEAIPYKGPALALFAYSDPALRRFVDLDGYTPRVFGRKCHRTPPQWSKARAGHIIRNIQIQHWRPKERCCAYPLLRLHASPNGQRLRHSCASRRLEFRLFLMRPFRLLFKTKTT